MISVEALLSAIVAIELAQLGVLGSTWIRSKDNKDRLDALLCTLGIDPEAPPRWELAEAAGDGPRADGGERDP